MLGLGGTYEHGPASVQLAWTQTARNRETQAPFGVNPSFLNMMQVAFNDANEKAWLIGGTLDFAVLGAPGLKVAALNGDGRGAVDSATGAPLGGRHETDLGVYFAFDNSMPLRGLTFGIEGSWLNQAGATAQGRQLRVYANYEIPFGRK
jgi:predicted porin